MIVIVVSRRLLAALALTLAMAVLVGYGLLAAAASDAAPQEKKSTLEQNKANVIAFYNLAANEHKPSEAVEKYMGKQYIQHNPNAADGAQAFIDFFTKSAKANPDRRSDFKRVIAEGDLVVVHAHMRKSKDDRGSAVIDIFRLENGKIVEHWDVVQPVPEKSANTNTMF